MRKCLLCLVGASFVIPHVFCQYYFYDANHLEPEWRIETGFSIGLMNCLTDLGGTKGNGKKFLQDVNWKLSKPAGGLYFSVTRHDCLGIRVAFSKGSVTANDSVLKGKDHPTSLRYNRNLHFRTKIVEWSAAMEFHPIYLRQGESPKVSPYISFGFGYFHFQPEARLDGNWISLQPLHTEGQGFKEYPKRVEYKLRQGNIPLGVGAKYDLSNLLVYRMEFEYRILFTDYLDDVSQNYIDPTLFDKYFPHQKAEIAQRLADRSGELNPAHQTKPEAIRGNAGNRDAYFSFTMKLGFVLNRKKL